MTPIVDGLEAEYGERVAFVRLNAGEGEGAQVFRQLGLPGHPSYAIYSAGGQEIFRTYGIVDATSLQSVVEEALR